MPKMKSKSSAKKRFRMTGTGKIRRSKAYGSHILTSKDQKRKRRLRKNDIVDKANAKHIYKQLPYGR